MRGIRRAIAVVQTPLKSNILKLVERLYCPLMIAKCTNAVFALIGSHEGEVHLLLLLSLLLTRNVIKGDE
jgi:hypothetical protein